MWANVCCSKYSHSRVTDFKQHLKHNNDFTKLIFKETHLPKHMRLSFPLRLVRFMFMPICIMAVVSLLNRYPVYKEIDEYCQRREECFANCISDNFPNLACERSDDILIEYQGNTYTNFFFYSKQQDSEQYNMCKDYINYNPLIERAPDQPDR